MLIDISYAEWEPNFGQDKLFLPFSVIKTGTYHYSIIPVKIWIYVTGRENLPAPCQCYTRLQSKLYCLTPRQHSYQNAYRYSRCYRNYDLEK